MRRYALLLTLLVVATIAAFFFRSRFLDEEALRPLAASPRLLEELNASSEAEKISNPRDRCRAYPDLSEFKWDRSVVEAYCELLARKSLSLEEIDDALSRGEIKRLDETFGDYMSQAYQHGMHGFLISAYEKAFSNEGALAVADRWVNADPDSAFALTARGTAYVGQAWRSRGDKVMRETSDDKVETMESYAAKGLADLKKAVKLSNDLNAAYEEMLSIGRLTGDESLFSYASHRALALDAADQWVYDYWVTSAAPKWGGSLEKMRDIGERALKHADENPLLKRVQARPLCEQAEMVNRCTSCGSIQQRSKRMLDFYREAAQLAPAACIFKYAGDMAEWAADYEMAVRMDSQAFRFGGEVYPLYRRAVALGKLGQFDRAIETAELAIRLQPNDPMGFVYKGWVLQDQHKPAEAEKSFLAAVQIDRDNREALSELVMLYTHELNDPAKGKAIVDRLMAENPNNARAWLLSGVLDHGKDERRCKIALEKYLALVDHEHADDYEQRDIDRATKRLAELANLDTKTINPTTTQ